MPTAPDAKITATWDETIDNGEYRIEYREVGAETWIDHATVPHDDPTEATIGGLDHGREYEVRVRTETDYATGEWVEATIVTALPTPTPVIDATTTDSVSLAELDPSNNTESITVERREYGDRLRDRTFGEWATVAELEPGTQEHTDDGLTHAWTYELRVTTETSDDEATSDAITAQTDVDPPEEGWFIALEDGAGDWALVPNRAISEDRPHLEPEASAKGRWRIDIAPESLLREWLQGEAYIYHDGTLRFRGPYTRYHPQGGAADVDARIEGLDIIQHLDRGGMEFPVTSEPGWEAFERFAEEELADEWDVTVHPPEESLVDEDFLAQDIGTGEELATLFGIDEDGSRWIRDGEDLHPGQQSFTRYAQSRDRDTGFSLDQTNDDAVNGEAWGINDEDHNLEFDETVDHDIPEEHVGYRIRYLPVDSGHAHSVSIAINGAETELGTFPTGPGFSSPSWFDLVGEFGWEGGDIEAGDEITFAIYGEEPGDFDETQWFDMFSVYDRRAEDRLTWSHELNENDQLPGPEYYVGVTEEAAEFSQEFNLVEATIDAEINDVSGDQRLQATNDDGETWLPDDGSEANTASVTADFAAAETFGTAVRGRATLGGHGEDATQTPTQGREPQRLSAWQLRIDTNSIRVIDNQTYRGSPYGIMDAIAEDSGLTFAPEYRTDELALGAMEPGAIVRDLRDEWTVVDSDPVDTTEGYYNTITVWGAEDDDGERLVVTASSQSEIDRVGEVPAGDDVDRDRPEATTEEELISIARTLLARGIARDRITGTIEIESQFAMPGYGYRVDEFAALEDDDVDEPAYVLEDAAWSWGTQELDFEARHSLARAIRSIETTVRTTKRAL